jgi:alpha-glucosidase/alpha-D-xyloside xylohydrolase
LSISNGKTGTVPNDGSLARTEWGPPVAALSGDAGERPIQCGALSVSVTTKPLALTISNANHDVLQRLKIDANTGVVSFLTGDSPLLGLGEGGPQFDRRGSTDEMRSGQGGYKLATHGGRVPIPWIIGTSGWAMFIHHPFGTFDFTGTEGKFQPVAEKALPLDIFFVGTRSLAHYGRIRRSYWIP